MKKSRTPAILIVALVLSVGLTAISGKAQNSFAAPQSISGVCGSWTNDNTGIPTESGAPTIAGFTPNLPIWYVWTAPQSGEVELDTIGSMGEFFGDPLDTTLGVFTGNSLSTLTQVAANDDLYPFPQENEIAENIFNVKTNSPPVWTNGVQTASGLLKADIVEYYSGPSGLRFNAVGGQTYYIAVDSKATPYQSPYYSINLYPPDNTGPLVLNWAYKSSGVFRIAAENFDLTGNENTNLNDVPLPLIQTSESETSERLSDNGYTVNADQLDTTLHTYYDYNVPGVPVTITRVAGSSGRIQVGYTTMDGDTNLILNGDLPAVAGVDYVPTTGTLIFDDFEMSKTIYVPIIDDFGVPNLNRDFTIVLTNAVADPYEDTNMDSASISQPRIDSNFGQAEIRILDEDIDPKGPAFSTFMVTNITATSTNIFTNTLWNLEPTNAIINFAKANYRVTRDVTNYWKGTLITVFASRNGTNAQSATANWIVNAGYLTDVNPGGGDELFPLEPASDYAAPDPASLDGITGTNSDFIFSSYGGTVSWGANDWNPKPIQFTVYNKGLVTFDKDFIINLYQLDKNGHPSIQPGMVDQAKVTILANRAPVTGETPADGRIPAGSVDENYNIDFGLDMAPPINTSPQQNNPTPGTDGEVHGLAVTPNNETLTVGEFDSYDGISDFGICLIDSNGVPDQSFNSGSGFNIRDGYAATCVAMTPDNSQFVVGGSFTSYNGSQCGGVARINRNGQLDGSFQSGSITGGTNGVPEVYALAVQPNGQVLIGGNFTQVNGVPRNYLARLNTDGSVDTTFNPGSTLNGPVYSLSLQQATLFATNVISTRGNPQQNDLTVNVSSNNLGTVTVNYVFPTTNQMLVFYGGTLIYNSGATAGENQFTVPYAGGNTPIDIMVNPGGALSAGTNYSYGAAVTSGSLTPEVVVGGNFNVAGQNYTDIALFNTNGVLDNSFNPTTGADQPVYALDWQPDGKILAGGNFQNVNATPVNRFVRFNADGTLDTTNFYAGIGADDTVFCINYIHPFNFSVITNNAGNTNVQISVTRGIYIGGQFSSYNGTHRLGFARLNTDGTVDTSFMDTAYNQFAGLPKIYSYDSPGVFATELQSDGSVMIGGNFKEVGGGQADKNTRDEIDDQLGIAESFSDPNLWLSLGGQNVEPNSRDGVRNRFNVARLIGGATPGPGNLSLSPSTSAGYQANRNQVTELVSLVRTNGFLGPESANFSIVPGTAQNGVDVKYQAAAPLDWVSWFYAGPTRMHSDGLSGSSGFLNNAFGQFFSGGFISLSQVNVTIFANNTFAGNLTATYQLANPPNADQFYLGGQDIPVACALGISSSPLTLIDNSQQAGTFGFQSPTFVATNLSPVITVVRQNGAAGIISINYATNTAGGTAIPGTDYVAIASTTLTFAQNQLTNTFNVSVLNQGVVYTNFTEKTVNLRLINLRPPGNGAAYGISNAVLRLINPNFPGYLTFSATNYTGSEAPPSGVISFTVNRVDGSQGSLTVQYATTNGTAFNNVDYVGATNMLEWDNGDVSPRTVTLPLINTGVVGTNKQFSVRIFNPRLNTFSDPSLFFVPGSITNATLTISNNNSYGSVQFGSTNYIVNESGGSATLTVVRSGGVAGPAYVAYATADGTAVSNVNYSARGGVLTFAPNQLSASLQIPITNNGLQGPPPSAFYFNVKLFNPTNLALGTLTNAQVNILDSQTYNQPPGSTNTAFNADINGNVLALAFQTNGQILAGGSFSDVNGLPENNLARLNADGSLDVTFLNKMAGANGTIQTIVNQFDNRIVVGGGFTTINGVNLNYIARLMVDGSIDTSFNPGAGANGPVYAIAQTFVAGVPEIYAGGSFSSLNSVISPGVARLNSNGTVDTAFNAGSGVDGSVYAIATYPTNSVFAGKVLIGGSFVHYNGAVVNGLVRVNADGSLDVAFNPGTAATNGVVDTIVIQPDGRALVGGSFAFFNGVTANNITRLNDDGSKDTNFTASVGSGGSDVVNGIVLQPDNNILVVGQFATANGVTRNGVTRLLPSGATDTTINFGVGANGAVNAALVQPVSGLITLGGAFTAFNGMADEHIVQVYGLSQTGSGTFEFSANSYQVNANGFVAPITIIRTGGTSGPNSDGSGNILVNFATSGGTASNGVNYVAVSNNVVFPPGEVSETINVPILNNFNTTSNVNVGLALSNPTPPATLGPIPTAILNILNINNAVSFTSLFTNVSESIPGGLANITITRQGATNGISVVQFLTTTNNSTGIPGTDYVPTNEFITFNPGDSTVSAQVLIISNNTIEKTVGLVLTNAFNTVLESPTNETLTIINNAGPVGQLMFASTNYTVNESGTNAILTVLRTNGFSGPITYGFTTVSGTAQPNINYQTVNGTISFTPNTMSQTISVPLLENNPPEGPVSFSVVLTNTTGSAATLLAPTNAAVTIIDDVDEGITFVNSTNYFVETNGAVSVLVERFGNTNTPVSVQYATTNNTALAGTNYIASTGTVNFSAGQNLAGISLTLINNQDVTNEQFGISLYGQTSGVQLIAPSNTVVVLQPSAAGITFTSPTNSVAKNANIITIPVVCLNPAAEPVIVDSNTIPLSVNYLTVNGTAVAGVDYTAVSGTLIFSNGLATNTITVPIINNSLITGLRTFSVILSNAVPVPPAQLVQPTNQVITIIDSNAGLSFSTPNYSIVDGGQAAITVVRSDNTNTVTTVNFATGGGTAVPFTDYLPTNGVLTFTNGQTSISFNISVIANSGVQPDKTILIGLSNPTNGILTAPNSATLTILNHNGSFVVPAGVALFSATNTPTGILQSGQQAQLWFSFRDAGGTNVGDLKATLLAANGVISPGSTNGTAVEDYGPLVVNGPSVTREFTLTPVGTNAQNILATFSLQDGTKSIGTNTFTLTIGTWTTSFTNTNAITIGPPLANFVSAIATPYPSMITVSNVGGVLVGTTVTITNFSHTSPQAVGVLVVSPAQQDTLLMSGVGTANVGASHVTLTFSDGATNSLPTSTTTSTPITNGVYKPTQDGSMPNFP